MAGADACRRREYQSGKQAGGSVEHVTARPDVHHRDTVAAQSIQDFRPRTQRRVRGFDGSGAVEWCTAHLLQGLQVVGVAGEGDPPRTAYRDRHVLDLPAVLAAGSGGDDGCALRVAVSVSKTPKETSCPLDEPLQLIVVKPRSP